MNFERHPLNAAGDFYVGNDMCIACEAPEHEAPDLMSHYDDDRRGNYHCYFKRQPETPTEIEKAIRAVHVGCCGAVRYCGTDDSIIAELVKLGSGNNCDNRP